MAKKGNVSGISSEIGSSTAMFRATSNVDLKKIRKIDNINRELVRMLLYYAGDAGLKLTNGRLPWSTLQKDLERRGYAIVNWPRGVVRDRDKGVSGLSAEDADKLHDALFVDEQRLQFVQYHGGEGKFLSVCDS